MFFIIGGAKGTILDSSKRTMTVSKFYFNVKSKSRIKYVTKITLNISSNLFSVSNDDDDDDDDDDGDDDTIFPHKLL